MFNLSITIEKDEIQGISASQLLHFYQRELHAQSVSSVDLKSNSIHFSNTIFKLNPNGIHPKLLKFSSFSSGKINLIETEKQFIVSMKASMLKLFAETVTLGFTTSVLMLVFFNSGKISAISTGICAYVLFTTIGYLYTKYFFPVYFATLRNKILKEIALIKTS